MRVVTFANFKGGCGKTTMAHHLAVRADERGLQTVAIDTDRQGDLYRRLAGQGERSSERPPIRFGSQGGCVYRPGELAVPTTYKNVSLIVVDTPPSVDLAKAGSLDVLVVPIDGIDAALNANEAVADALELDAKLVVLLKNGTSEGGVRFRREFASIESELPERVVVAPFDLPRADAIKRSSVTNRPAWKEPYKAAAATSIRDVSDWLLDELFSKTTPRKS